MGSPSDRSRVTIRVFWLIDFTVAVAVTVLLAVREFFPAWRVATAAGGGGRGGLCLAHAPRQHPQPANTPPTPPPPPGPPPSPPPACPGRCPPASRTTTPDSA